MLRDPNLYNKRNPLGSEMVGPEMVGMTIQKHGYDKREIKTVFHSRVFIWRFSPFPPFPVPPFPTLLDLVITLYWLVATSDEYLKMKIQLFRFLKMLFKQLFLRTELLFYTAIIRAGSEDKIQQVLFTTCALLDSILAATRRAKLPR